MPTYSYRCEECGGFPVRVPMAEVSSTAMCPTCGAAARREYAGPGVRVLDAGLRRAFDTADRSAGEPTVTSSVPGRSRRATPITRDPRHARLPRP
ncbi:MAG: FmdB family zinc ribbon protein [Mycobacterium sp.]